VGICCDQGTVRATAQRRRQIRPPHDAPSVRDATLRLALQNADAWVKADRFGQAGGSGAQYVDTLLGVLGMHGLSIQAPASAHAVGERLGLSREEVGSLSRLKVGQAILVLHDQQHLPVRVLAPPLWMPTFETDMASMQRSLARAMHSAAELEPDG
jgi:hypothetical protein